MMAKSEESIKTKVVAAGVKLADVGNGCFMAKAHAFASGVDCRQRNGPSNPNFGKPATIQAGDMQNLGVDSGRSTRVTDHDV